MKTSTFLLLFVAVLFLSTRIIPAPPANTPPAKDIVQKSIDAERHLNGLLKK